MFWQCYGILSTSIRGQKHRKLFKMKFVIYNNAGVSYNCNTDSMTGNSEARNCSHQNRDVAITMYKRMYNLQWKLNLTKCQETREIGSLY